MCFLACRSLNKTIYKSKTHLMNKVFSVNEKQEKIAKRILDYLRKNPDASDTLEGITRWWLESERIDRAVDDVSEAINVLLKQGLLKKFERSDGNLMFKPDKEDK